MTNEGSDSVMDNILYLHRFMLISEVDTIEQRGEGSWWVLRHRVSRDGIQVPGSRVVFFTASEASARAWVERNSAKAASRSGIGQMQSA